MKGQTAADVLFYVAPAENPQMASSLLQDRDCKAHLGKGVNASEKPRPPPL